MKKIAFTMVLNGMPFIERQANIIPKVFDKWYIIEGVCRPVRDTSWCREIPSHYYSKDFTSVDGTTEFLDKISKEHGDRIQIIRKNAQWEGKLEMCNSFISEISNSILMEFDVDEIWDKEVLKDVLDYCSNNNGFDGMLFDCDFFVGDKLTLHKCGGYADSAYEWSRLWIIDKPTYWIAHEPPHLRGCSRFLTKPFTKSRGWTFQHYAYTTKEQLMFKEDFYGYKNAYEKWKSLQEIDKSRFPVYARDYLPWIHDNTRISLVKN